MKRLIFSLISLAVVGGASASPLWMRYNTISPDGSTVAFSYKGDIYVVPSEGGEARQLTTTDHYEYMPIFSPDSKSIAFASNRYGNFDIFTVGLQGGAPTQVTTNSAIDTPLAFSQDGKSIYYSAHLQKSASNVQFPTSAWITELYLIPVGGGREVQISANPVMNMSLDQGGSFFYENRTGGENNWRKHHTSSVARDIYYYDAAAATHTRLTDNVGEDRNPVLIEGDRVLFLSERDGGTFNIYVAPRDNMEAAEPLTTYKDHPVRFLSVAADGTICFGYHGQIYTMKEGSKPQLLSVSIVNDKEESVQNFSVSPSASAMTPSGDQIIFEGRGEIFATTDEYPTTKRVTNSAAAERGATISPDGRTIVYASERNGKWELFKSEIVRDQEVNFANATLLREEPLFKVDKKERLAPRFSPDGTELAFVEDRNKLMVMNLESGKVRQVTDGSKHVTNSDYGLDYKWSPNGEWFVMSIITNDRAPYSDIAIVSSQGGDFYNITSSAYIDTDPTWALDGNAILFTSNRYGMRSHASWGSQNDIFLAFLNKKSYDEFQLSKEEKALKEQEEKQARKASGEEESEADDKEPSKEDKKAEEKSKSADVEVDKLEDMVVRLTPMSGKISGGALSEDATKLYFLGSFDKSSTDLWQLDIKGHELKSVKRDVRGKMQLSEDKKSLFILGSKSFKIDMKSDKAEAVGVSATMNLDRAAEREYMFNHVFLQQAKRFYNPNYHGVDLVKLKEEYAPFLPHVANNYDFAEMLSEILGELNVSHTGSGYRAPSAAQANRTAELGLYYDLSYRGDGLKVDEVKEGGPFDRKESKIESGVIVEKIDGVAIKAGEDYYPLLNRKAGEKSLISLYNPTSGERWDEVVKPIVQGSLSTNAYERWVKSRAAEVERLSGGRLGYVHIKSMDDDSYRTIYSDILGKYNNYDGVVIDTRFNGGGRLHEDVEILFSGEKYLEQVVRGELYGNMPSRRYNKASIMITGEANYSNAHGTPWVYQQMGLGSLVGMPVPGTMTSVSWETLQDPTLYFGIPIVGYRTKDGEYLENSQIEPDIKVANTPEALEQGRDEQLEAAVEELLRQIDSDVDRW